MEMSGSFSTGHVAYEHDVRETSTKNVDKDLSQDNMVMEDNLAPYYWYEENGKTMHRTQEEAIEMYVNEMMQPYIDEYNKGKKPSRQIKEPYVEYWKKNGNQGKGKAKLVYEAVAQVGEHATNGREYYQAKGKDRHDKKEMYKEMYDKALREFKKKYPHLKVLWATLHLDEPGGTPHLHIAYVPVGENYKKGLSHQVSIGNALACDGILRSETRSKEGFQLSRMYAQVRNEIVKPKIGEYFKEYTVKKEIHGREHVPPRDWFSGQEKEAAAALDKLTNEKETIWQEIATKVQSIISEFFKQEDRQRTLEKRVPQVKKEIVFGRANELNQAFRKEISSTYEKIGRVEAPEVDLMGYLEKYDKELTRIEIDQNKPVEAPEMEELLEPDEEWERD